MFNVLYDAAVTTLATRRLLQNAKGLKGISGITGITRILLYNNIHYVSLLIFALPKKSETHFFSLLLGCHRLLCQLYGISLFGLF